MTLGDKIRKYRTLKGLTQAQLGSMVKLTGDRIRQYQNDVRKPKDGKLFEIADALDVNPSTLAEPDFDDPTSVMHVLFELEDIYGLHFEKVGDNYITYVNNYEIKSSKLIVATHYPFKKLSRILFGENVFYILILQTAKVIYHKGV